MHEYLTIIHVSLRHVVATQAGQVAEAISTFNEQIEDVTVPARARRTRQQARQDAETDQQPPATDPGSATE